MTKWLSGGGGGRDVNVGSTKSSIEKYRNAAARSRCGFSYVAGHGHRQTQTALRDENYLPPCASAIAITCASENGGLSTSDSRHRTSLLGVAPCCRRHDREARENNSAEIWPYRPPCLGILSAPTAGIAHGVGARGMYVMWRCLFRRRACVLLSVAEKGSSGGRRLRCRNVLACNRGNISGVSAVMSSGLPYVDARGIDGR